MQLDKTKTYVKVTLWTADFGFVHQGWMPKFDEMPKILFWGQGGQRVFEYSCNGRYIETFSYALVNIPIAGQTTLFEKLDEENASLQR